MTIVARLLTLLAVLLGIPLLTAGTATEIAAAQATTAGPTFTVDGQVAAPQTLGVSDLRRWPVQQEVVHFLAGGRPEVHQFRGARLVDVLTAAKPAFNPAMKHDELRYAVLVGGTDGYHAALSWGELDPDLAGIDVLLAYEQDGRALARPRLVVPSDKEGARYVTDIASVSLLRLGG